MLGSITVAIRWGVDLKGSLKFTKSSKKVYVFKNQNKRRERIEELKNILEEKKKTRRLAY